MRPNVRIDHRRGQLDHQVKPSTKLNTNTRVRKGLNVTLALLIVFCACACRSLNVNPPIPEPGTGYADFSADTQEQLSWDIQQWDAKAGRMKILFSEVQTLKEPALRLVMKPGVHRLRINFLNRVVAQPADVEVDIKDGQITPVKVTLTGAGTTSVATREDRFTAPSVKGRYGRGARFGSYEATAYRLDAVAGESVAYKPKQPPLP